MYRHPHWNIEATVTWCYEGQAKCIKNYSLLYVFWRRFACLLCMSLKHLQCMRFNCVERTCNCMYKWLCVELAGMYTLSLSIVSCRWNAHRRNAVSAKGPVTTKNRPVAVFTVSFFTGCQFFHCRFSLLPFFPPSFTFGCRNYRCRFFRLPNFPLPFLPPS